jgi:hypothetical protein
LAKVVRSRRDGLPGCRRTQESQGFAHVPPPNGRHVRDPEELRVEERPVGLGGIVELDQRRLQVHVQRRVAGKRLLERAVHGLPGIEPFELAAGGRRTHVGELPPLVADRRQRVAVAQEDLAHRP